MDQDDGEGQGDKTTDDAVATATELAAARESIKKLEKTNKDLKSEKEQTADELTKIQNKVGDFDIEAAKERLAQFEGVDVEAIQAQAAKLDSEESKQLLLKGEFNKLFAKDKARLEASHEGQVKALNTQLEEVTARAEALESTLISTVRGDGISQAFVASEADKSQLRAAQAIAKDTVLVDGKFVPVVSVDRDGKSVFRHSTTGQLLENAEGDFGYRDWLVHLSEKEGLPLFAKPNSHSDPNAITNSNPKGYVKSKMTTEQKQKFKQEHGIQAYNALPFS